MTHPNVSAIDPRWIELFRREFDEMAERLDVAADALVHAYADEHVNEAFRALHTIKGNSFAIGLAGVGELAHRFERALGLIRDGRGRRDASLGELLLDVTDALRRMVDAPATPPSVELCARIAQLVPDDVELAEPVHGSAAAAKVVLVADDEPRLEGALPPLSEADGPPPIPPGMTPAPDAVHAAPPPPPAAAAATNPSLSVAGRAETLVIPVDVNDLNELVAATEALRALAQADGDHLLARRAEDLSRGLLAIRHLGVSKIVPRLRRLVRDTARSLGKPVSLTIEGEELDGDAAVIRDLSEALPHMLRNAIDHGIEKPGERETVSKPPEGQITLRFVQGSDAFIVEVEDDGRGMDPDAILEKALRKDLVTEEEGARMSREQRLALIFRPGFSTREEATSVSGRGVGMDIVADVVERHRGRIDIETRRGAGSRFTLRFPTLFRYEEYLVVDLDSRPIGLPVRYVAEIIEREDAPVVEDGLVVFRGEALPVIGFRDLDPLFGGSERRALVVLGFERGRMAIAVDALDGFAGTLIQPLPGRSEADYMAGVGQAPDGRQLWGIDLEKVSRDVEAYRVEGWGGNA
jgi:chemotaxis protein histidine kinase CheA